MRQAKPFVFLVIIFTSIVSAAIPRPNGYRGHVLISGELSSLFGEGIEEPMNNVTLMQCFDSHCGSVNLLLMPNNEYMAGMGYRYSIPFYGSKFFVHPSGLIGRGPSLINVDGGLQIGDGGFKMIFYHRYSKSTGLVNPDYLFLGIGIGFDFYD